jgi:hypothetical protein
MMDQRVQLREDTLPRFYALSPIERIGESAGIGDEPLSIDLQLHLVWEKVRHRSLRKPGSVGSSD